MAKMKTIKQIAVGGLERDGGQARIERNLFECNGETFEAIRFCKNKNGRHVRVHLVVREEEFVELFANAVRKGVFGEATLLGLFDVLKERSEGSAEGARRTRRAPFAEIAGLFKDGTLSGNIDGTLYAPGKE
jgi:hypothetical protein